jgi:hypothetical protein
MSLNPDCAVESSARRRKQKRKVQFETTAQPGLKALEEKTHANDKGPKSVTYGTDFGPLLHKTDQTVGTN